MTVSKNIQPELKGKDMKKFEKETGEMPEKSFRYRESALTELLNENEHVRSFKNLIWTLVILYVLNYFIYDLYFKQELKDDILLLGMHFKGTFNVLVTCWLPMLLSTFVVNYCGFRLWASCRRKSTTNAAVYVDTTFLILALMYIAGFVLLPLNKLTGLPYGTRGIIIPEQIRMLMKGYAFVRSNVPKVISEKEQEQDQQELEKKNTNSAVMPEFSKYVYFMFAPTLVYKDKYPRILHIKWNVIAKLCFEIISLLLVGLIVTKNVVIPYYRNVQFDRINIEYIIYIYLASFFHSLFYFVLMFYGLLHLWMNLWAEILRFGDRRFYSYWWCATSLPEYLRTWNTLVQDWIYTYLFRDFNKLFNKNRPLTLLCTLLTSSLVHDYLFGAIAGLYIPVFNFIYGLAMLSIYVPMPKNGWSNSFVFCCKAGTAAICLTYIALEVGSMDNFHPRQMISNNSSVVNVELSNYFYSQKIFV